MAWSPVLQVTPLRNEEEYYVDEKKDNKADRVLHWCNECPGEDCTHGSWHKANIWSWRSAEHVQCYIMRHLMMKPAPHAIADEDEARDLAIKAKICSRKETFEDRQRERAQWAKGEATKARNRRKAELGAAEDEEVWERDPEVDGPAPHHEGSEEEAAEDDAADADEDHEEAVHAEDNSWKSGKSAGKKGDGKKGDGKKADGKKGDGKKADGKKGDSKKGGGKKADSKKGDSWKGKPSKRDGAEHQVTPPGLTHEPVMLDKTFAIMLFHDVICHRAYGVVTDIVHESCVSTAANACIHMYIDTIVISQEWRRELDRVNNKLDVFMDQLTQAGEHVKAIAERSTASSSSARAPWHDASLQLVPVRKRVTLDASDLQQLYSSTRQVCMLCESTEKFADSLSAQIRFEKSACASSLRKMQRIADDNDIELTNEFCFCVVQRLVNSMLDSTLRQLSQR